MHLIQPVTFGYRLAFAGNMFESELLDWIEDSRQAMASSHGTFGVLFDVRDMAPLSERVEALWERGRSIYMAAGMQRSAVILRSSTLTLDARRKARAQGIDGFERYLNASERSDWSDAAEAWLTGAVDPYPVPVHVTA